MREIVRILCGSHLYGSTVEGSDRDYKIVYIPSGRNILLQHADRLEEEEMTPAVKRVRNLLRKEKYFKNPDLEFMSYRQYLKLLCQGQTNALDMAFAPTANYLGMPEPEWFALQLHLPKFISRNSASFVGYCRDQAKKYAVKMDRYDAVKSAVDFFAKALPAQKVGHVGADALQRLVNGSEHIEWVMKETAHGAELSHLSVCQTMVPVTASCRLALDTFKRKLDDYGRRVKAVADMDEKDWKSMYHAVRVAEEALELMKTGRLTFPRPERRLLTAVRLGKIPFEKVSNMIEENLKRVENAVENSTLPEQPDWAEADRLVAAFYRNAVLREG